jgi:hypothetical protein
VDHPDAELLRAWDRWLVAMRDLLSRSGDGHRDEDREPYHAAIDEA